MSLEQIVLYVIIGLVLIGIPVLISKLTGKNPMEVVFGRHYSKSAFAGGDQKESVGQEKTGRKSDAAGIQKNGSKNDLLALISSLLNYGRRNHFYVMVPGTLELDTAGKTYLPALLATRCGVFGINGFGYGGSIRAVSGETDPWVQTINGEAKRIDSPAAKNAQQKAVLQEILKDAGYENIPVEVLGVFTSPDVALSGAAAHRCYTSAQLMTELSRDRYLKDDGIDPKEIGASLKRYAQKENAVT